MIQRRSVIVLALVIISGYFFAAGAADQPELLIRHREALGGAEALQKIQDLHRISEVQIMELQGLLEEWSAAPDSCRMSVKMPAMSQSQGRIGLTEWTLDHNDQLNTKRLKMPEGAVWAPVLPEYQYLFPGTGANPRDLGEEDRNGKTYRVLEICHLDRSEVSRLLLDPETYLIVYEDGEEEGLSVTVEYKDYRVIEGVMIPHVLIQTLKIAGMPPSTMTVKEITVNGGIDSGLFELPDKAVVDFLFTGNNHRVTVPVSMAGEHLIIDVKVNGEGPFNFLLDSGAGTSLLDKKLAGKLGFTMLEGMKAVGIGGAEDLGATKIDSLSIGEFKIMDLNLFATDLAFIGQALQTQIDGIVGYDLFARCVVKLDYRNRELTIIDAEEFEYSGKGDVIAGEIRSNLIHIQGRIDDNYDGWFRVDTGASGAVHLHGPFVEKHSLMEKYQPQFEAEAAGAGGSQTIVIARAGSIQLGTGYFIENPLISMPKGGGGGAMTMVDSIATIGNRVWSRFTLYFDYGNKRLILEPNETFYVPMVFNRCGFTVSYSDGLPEIQHVFQGKQAEKAGIKPGDLILKINKLHTEELSHDRIQAMLDGPENTRIKIKLERAGKKFTRKIVLKDYL